MSGGEHSRNHASDLPRRFSNTQLVVPLFVEDCGAAGAVAGVGSIRRDRDDCAAAALQ